MIVHLYHVTPTKNVLSILTRGLDPEFSRGKRKTVWVCEYPKLHWALAHVSYKHETAVSDLTVFMFSKDINDVIKTAWRGVYNYNGIITVSHESIIETATIVESEANVY